MEVSLPSGGAEHTLGTVRILHETVFALQCAFEGSRTELPEVGRRGRDRGSREDDRPVMEAGGEAKGCESTVDAGSKADEEEGDEEEEGEEAEDRRDSEAESEDIDDIELVFTTGEADPGALQEDMVPIWEERKPLTHTVIVETDISKCGVIEETEPLLSPRRNTLSDPIPYRPMVHREVLAAARAARGSPRRSRPSAGDRAPARLETGAQTDITAVPGQWKSETYLAHKMPYNLTTLPSKFALPVPQSTRASLTEKDRGAKRVLLSDINFTSMVPELSRSADHLHQDEGAGPHPYRDQPDDSAYVKSGSDWEGKLSRSACDSGRHDSRSSWESRCQASATSIAAEEPRRRHTWRAPAQCCHSRHSWASFRCHPVHSACSYEPWICPNSSRRRPPSHRCCPPGASLPDLRGDPDSGDSTDSLIEEAEEFLRRSIDNMMVSRTNCKVDRRRSESDSSFGLIPPKSAQPFLPKTPLDLRCDCLVKVITADGRIVMGRVRYSGHVAGKAEPHVGIELHSGTGACDGTFLEHKYFDCKPDHGIFVPFKKVVLAWCT